MKFLFVASSGGHLYELSKLSERFSFSPESVWVTFDTPQSRELLSGKNVTYVPYISPRDFKNIFKAALVIHRLLKSQNFDTVISTGAGIALSALWQRPFSGIRRIYIESISRHDGPSLTGKIIQLIPSIKLYSQHESWAKGRWRKFPSVFNFFERDLTWLPQANISKIFVTLGTIRPYRFDRLIDTLTAVIPPETEISWQLGSSTRKSLPGKIYTEMSPKLFDEISGDADLVVTHAGIGTVLALLERGIPMLVVPRRSKFQEHVDDHQEQIARLLLTQEICVVKEADKITAESLREAAAIRTKRVTSD